MKNIIVFLLLVFGSNVFAKGGDFSPIGYNDIQERFESYDSVRVYFDAKGNFELLKQNTKKFQSFVEENKDFYFRNFSLKSYRNGTSSFCIVITQRHFSKEEIVLAIQDQLKTYSNSDIIIIVNSNLSKKCVL